MNPHRRKDTPPRRESSSDHNAGASDENDSAEYFEQEEPVADEQSNIIYDPGAALMDENQQYGEPEYSYEDPAPPNEEQGYVYEDPPQSAFSPPPSVYPTGGIYDETPQSTYEEPPAPQPRRTKKKVPGRAPQRRPALPTRSRSVSQYNRPKPAYSGGGISVMTVFLTLVALGMLALVVMVILPRDMSTVGGYPVNPLATGKPRNLLEESQKIMIQRTSEISFTEEEVNQYLNQRLQAEQTGPMAALVKFRGVYIDFSAGFAEVVIERELFGMPLTMTSKIKSEKFRQQTVYRAEGWTLGRIDLGARNIKPVIELFLRLRNTCTDEFQTLQQMVTVRFEENKLVLDSRI